MNEKIQKMIDSRQKYNLKLLEVIKNEVNNNPELRFGQILVDLGIIDYEHDYINEVSIVKDPFHEESQTTWVRVAGMSIAREQVKHVTKNK